MGIRLMHESDDSITCLHCFLCAAFDTWIEENKLADKDVTPESLDDIIKSIGGFVGQLMGDFIKPDQDSVRTFLALLQSRTIEGFNKYQLAKAKAEGAGVTEVGTPEQMGEAADTIPTPASGTKH